eukprot:scaffold368_cov258-Pinguiococcus_pyrenoidosus.AAC.25
MSFRASSNRSHRLQRNQAAWNWTRLCSQPHSHRTCFTRFMAMRLENPRADRLAVLVLQIQQGFLHAHLNPVHVVTKLHHPAAEEEKPPGADHRHQHCLRSGSIDGLLRIVREEKKRRHARPQDSAHERRPKKVDGRQRARFDHDVHHQNEEHKGAQRDDANPVVQEEGHVDEAVQALDNEVHLEIYRDKQDIKLLVPDGLLVRRRGQQRHLNEVVAQTSQRRARNDLVLAFPASQVPRAPDPRIIGVRVVAAERLDADGADGNEHRRRDEVDRRPYQAHRLQPVPRGALEHDPEDQDQEVEADDGDRAPEEGAEVEDLRPQTVVHFIDVFVVGALADSQAEVAGRQVVEAQLAELDHHPGDVQQVARVEAKMRARAHTECPAGHAVLGLHGPREAEDDEHHRPQEDAEIEPYDNRDARSVPLLDGVVVHQDVRQHPDQHVAEEDGVRRPIRRHEIDRPEHQDHGELRDDVHELVEHVNDLAPHSILVEELQLLHECLGRHVVGLADLLQRAAAVPGLRRMILGQRQGGCSVRMEGRPILGLLVLNGCCQGHGLLNLISGRALDAHHRVHVFLLLVPSASGLLGEEAQAARVCRPPRGVSHLLEPLVPDFPAPVVGQEDLERRDLVALYLHAQVAVRVSPYPCALQRHAALGFGIGIDLGIKVEEEAACHDGLHAIHVALAVVLAAHEGHIRVAHRSRVAQPREISPQQRPLQEHAIQNLDDQRQKPRLARDEADELLSGLRVARGRRLQKGRGHLRAGFLHRRADAFAGASASRVHKRASKCPKPQLYRKIAALRANFCAKTPGLSEELAVASSGHRMVEQAFPVSPAFSHLRNHRFQIS